MHVTSRTSAPRRASQSGFSLLELLVAMMIIAVIATLGFKQYNKYSAQARYLKAQDTLRIVGDGLDQYFLKHGIYPNLSSYEAMVDANSPLVKENMIPVNVPAKDPWGQPYEASSAKGRYELKCQGDPNSPEERAPFTVEPGKMPGDATSAPAASGSGAPSKGTAP
jgi:prepilin-type N-terminal cleavage/methylation domain-containing protein